ncbi:MAG: FUSC family protein [Thermodesulfobacteriota bacterium]|nr:FUSC family protein [Thermodesulfobacteriota bacterium]
MGVKTDNIDKKKFSFPKVHAIHGLKTALASVLAYGITTFFNLEYGYWALFSTVIVMQVYVADSINMCLYRLSGTIIGAALGVAGLLIFPPTVLWTGVSIFLFIGLCSFMTHYNKRYRMAAITVSIVIMTGLAAPDKIDFGLARVLEIGIGIFCAFIVSVLIFPVRMVDLLKKNLKIHAEECADNYDKLLNAFLSGQKNVDENLLEDLSQKVWKNHELYQNIKRHEALIYPKKFNKNLAAAVSIMDRMVEHLRTMTRILNMTKGKEFKIIMDKELIKLADKSKKALFKLIRNDSSDDLGELSRAVAEAEQKLNSLRSKGVTIRFDLQKLIQVYSFYHSMHYLAEDLIQANKRH